MGKYTAWNDPVVDQTVEDHLQQIVGAVCSHLTPRAIALRGSFSQGEGTVLIEDGSLRFLSDYELIAVTPHYRDRRWLRAVAQQATDQLGVETSISRVHPDNLELNSLGNLRRSSLARPSIAMYEIQKGGRTLFGEDLLNRGPAIDPSTLNPWVGIRLLLNRLAESLTRLAVPDDSWDQLRWINKTILACADALLIVFGQYHFSYAERGRRFAALAPRLGLGRDEATHLSNLVKGATAFKLCPSRELYADPPPQLWDQVKRACDSTLRTLSAQGLGFTFGSYAEFPPLYLNRVAGGITPSLRPWPAKDRLVENLFLGLKFLRAKRQPPLGLFTQFAYPPYQIVYAVVPLMFLGGDGAVLPVARQWLRKVTYLPPACQDSAAESDCLRKFTFQVWKDLCYGMWDAVAI